MQTPTSANTPPPAAKMVSREELRRLRDRLDAEGKRLVLTNGCFDILHEGHRLYLEQASREGDFLAVALNDDQSVRSLKGPSRPVRGEQTRLSLVAELPFVDAVLLFSETHVTSLLREVRPHLYVKGGDYTIETIDQGLRRALEELGIEARFLGHVEGVSTTILIAKGLAGEAAPGSAAPGAAAARQNTGGAQMPVTK